MSVWKLAQGSEEHSDVETSTASEGSSGGAPWTVVTSPRKGSQDDEVTSQAKAAEPPASATPSTSALETPSGDSAPAAVAPSKLPAAHLLKSSAPSPHQTGPLNKEGPILAATQGPYRSTCVWWLMMLCWLCRCASDWCSEQPSEGNRTRRPGSEGGCASSTGEGSCSAWACGQRDSGRAKEACHSSGR